MSGEPRTLADLLRYYAGDATLSEKHNAVMLIAASEIERLHLRLAMVEDQCERAVQGATRLAERVNDLSPRPDALKRKEERWLCLLCLSGNPGRHAALSDGTPCPNGQRGRPASTGRFSTREELAAYVWRTYTGTAAKVPDIARQCRVSEAVVHKILSSERPQEPKEAP